MCSVYLQLLLYTFHASLIQELALILQHPQTQTVLKEAKYLDCRRQTWCTAFILSIMTVWKRSKFNLSNLSQVLFFFNNNRYRRKKTSNSMRKNKMVFWALIKTIDVKQKVLSASVWWNISIVAYLFILIATDTWAKNICFVWFTYILRCSWLLSIWS